jgi:hypothetical protein
MQISASDPKRSCGEFDLGALNLGFEIDAYRRDQVWISLRIGDLNPMLMELIPDPKENRRCAL